jgi:hypothetical protein
LLKSDLARVFWLTYFKTKLAVSADEFFAALLELAEMSFAG